MCTKYVDLTFLAQENLFKVANLQFFCVFFVSKIVVKQKWVQNFGQISISYGGFSIQMLHAF